MMQKTDAKKHLPMLLILASFSALFIVIGFIAGWELRWSEDVMDEKHASDAAERAATLTEQQILRLLKSDLCRPEQKK